MAREKRLQFRILLDAGVFIGAAHGDRVVAGLMKAAAGNTIFSVAAHTVSEFYRGGSRSAAEAHLMAAWRVEFLDVTVADGKLAGELLARTGGDDSMDALLVALGSRYQVRQIFTGDTADLTALRDALPPAGQRDLSIIDIKRQPTAA